MVFCITNLGSSVVPKSERNFSPMKLIGPMISMASGKKIWDCAIAEYLLFFHQAAPSAKIPTFILAEATYVAASVSATVASHVRYLLSCQEIRLIPSGRFLSERERPAGSLTDGMLARVRACQIRSLSWWWQIEISALAGYTV